MAVKTTYQLSESMELTKEQIKGIPQENSKPPAKSELRQINKSEKSITRFMDFYSDVVFSIMNVIEKTPELISKDSFYGSEYGAIKISSKDFSNFLFAEFPAFKSEFTRKLNSIADSAPSVWIVEEDENGIKVAKSIYPILIKRTLRSEELTETGEIKSIRPQNENLNGYNGVIADFEIDFNKELFIGKETNGLTKAFRLLPNTLPTTIKDFTKKNKIEVSTTKGKTIKLQEKQFFRFIMFLRNHFNRRDFLQNPVEMAKIFNSELINTKGFLTNKEDFFLHIVIFIYAYNSLFLENKLDGFDFSLGIPEWQTEITKNETKQQNLIRIPTFPMESMKTTKNEKTRKETYNGKSKIITEVFTSTQELSGMSQEEIYQKAKETNEHLKQMYI